MTTRNRTERFCDFKENYRSRRGHHLDAFPLESDDSKRLLGSSDHVAIPMSTNPPKWFAVIEEIKSDISEIEVKLRDLDSLHSDHLLVGFGDEEGDKKQRIQNITAKITHIFQGANVRLKSLVLSKLKSEDEAREDQLRRNVRATLANQLQHLSLEFRRKQREYLEKVRDRQFQGSDLFKTDDSERNPLDEIGFTDGQLEKVALAQSSYNQKSQEIQSIVKSITELAEITNDLRSLVVDQGTILDRIDFNIEQVHNLVKESDGTVTDLNKDSKNSRKKTLIIGLFVAVLILCVMLILKFLWRVL